MSVFRVQPTIQQYDWGKIGSTSKVAQFASRSNLHGFHLDETKPYAELWMGTHPSSPSLISIREGEPTKPLADHLRERRNLIGQQVADAFSAQDGNLPFLLKVLSIQKALSIQVHPDKPTAERLHTEKPGIYKDPNHKPEMAIALTPFTALCGFLPVPRIARYLSTNPEFSKIIPSPIYNNFLSASKDVTATTGSLQKEALKLLWTALMTTDPLDEHIKTLISRYESGSNLDPQDEIDVRDLVLTLSRDFPGDIGVLCVFMLNVVHLQPGEAIFLGAGEPHAYIAGDIIECMANSDNVIRAGLTPKLRDIPTLNSCLTYISAEPSEHAVKPSTYPANWKPPPSSAGPTTVIYNPPIPEFSVLLTRLSYPSSKNGSGTVRTKLSGPSISVVTQGKGWVKWIIEDTPRTLNLGEGDVIFVGADIEVTFGAAKDEGEGRGGEMMVFRAFVEVHHEEV